MNEELNWVDLVTIRKKVILMLGGFVGRLQWYSIGIWVDKALAVENRKKKP